jgi:hypothetical protein
MIEHFTARSGAPSLRMGGRALHSPYDPVEEARRFIDQNATEAPSTVLLLGEALGYASEILRARYPDAHLVLIFYSAEIFSASPQGSAMQAATPGISWHPGLPTGLAEFLRYHVGELDLEGLQVLEWPASARLFPEVSRAAHQAVRQVVQELNGSFLTTMQAGKLWIRNSISNYLALETALVGAPCAEDRPVVIAASGPTLEESASLLARVRSRIDLWALPSACHALRRAGLEPDLVVLTDPGFYALQHLRFAGVKCPLAMPLSAARGPWDLPVPGAESPGLPVFLLAQPGFLETPLLRSLGIEAPVVPPHGTVAATAIDLALSFTRAPVIAAGLDMCSRDLATHARPAEFDTLLHAAATRLSPHTGLSFARAASQGMSRAPGSTDARISPSLRTYAGWFSRPQDGGPGRVFRLLPSPIPLEGMVVLDAGSLQELLEGAHSRGAKPLLHPCAAIPRRGQRLKVVKGLLEGWAGELAAARAAIASLHSLAAIGELPTVLALAYHVEPQLLMETRRAARRGDRDGALSHATDMLSGCGDFMALLQSKVAHAA